LLTNHITGEEELSKLGVTMMCWDADLMNALRGDDHLLALSEVGDIATESRERFEFITTSKAALWGCNAVTIKAAAQLTAHSECFKHFSEKHRNELLQVIKRAGSRTEAGKL
jgi:hypothetical protein